ncbi:MAG: heavy metal translocating P-type ATPase [Desulfobacterales bacterium]|nr:heavy metal translocating P-type ATPase [Desulfobacterales bacterium]
MIFLMQLAITGASLYAGLKGYQHSKPLKKSKKIPQDSVPQNSVAILSPELNSADIPIDDKSEREHLEKITDQKLAAAGGSLALITTGMLTSTPLLVPLSIPGLIYIGTPIVTDAYQSIFKDRQVRASILDAISLTAMLVTRNLFACSLAGFLLTGSEKLLLKTEDESRKSLTNIFRDQPKFVWILRNEVEVEVPFENVKGGDVIVANAGEYIPSDGIIVKGIASIDQHQLTGEAQPAEKKVGDSVFAGTVILSGRINIQVEKAGRDTVIAQLGNILNRTADFKTSIQSRGQVIADKAVIPTLALGAMAVPLGGTHALAVLNAGFGYNMRLIAPISMLNFLSIASQEGILIKDGRSLELLKNTDIVVFDKTGTLTLIQPEIAKIYCYTTFTEDQVLFYTAVAEYRQTHPIAQAILQAAKEREIELPITDHIRYEVGYGIQADFESQSVKVGSIRFMTMEGIAVPDEISDQQANRDEEGASFIYVAVNNELAGVIELQSIVRPEVRSIVQKLKESGKQIYIISGDHEKPTRKLANDLGIEHYFSEVLPEDKANLITQLQQKGHSVCFVGDGINDAIALKKANVSISLRGASTIATDSAQIVFMGQSLKQLIPLFDLASQFNSNLDASYLTTLIPGAICVGGVFFLGFGIFTSIMLYNVGLIAGIGNAMLPRLKSLYTEKPDDESTGD